MDILKGGGLAYTGRSYQYYEAVVKRGRLADSSYDSVGKWLRH